MPKSHWALFDFDLGLPQIDRFGGDRAVQIGQVDGRGQGVLLVRLAIAGQPLVGGSLFALAMFEIDAGLFERLPRGGQVGLKGRLPFLLRGQAVANLFEQQKGIGFGLGRAEFVQVVELRLQTVVDMAQLVVMLGRGLKLDIDEIERPEQIDLLVGRIDRTGRFATGHGRLLGFGELGDFVGHFRPLGGQIVGLAGWRRGRGRVGGGKRSRVR